MVDFTDETIEKIFGADDAENENSERLLEYFYKSEAYEQLTSNLAVRVLVAHKGVGKSALLKRAFLADEQEKKPALWLRPNDLVETKTSAAAQSDFVLRVEEWKRGILREVLSYLVVGTYGQGALDTIAEAALNRPKSLLILIQKALTEDHGGQNINVYIDDIDRGWAAEQNDIRNISALLTALRDIGGDAPNVRFRLGLRSDVYFLVRTSDESTDKIERNVIWLRWNNDDILRMAALRVATYFKLDYDQGKILSLTQRQISDQILSHVIAPRYQGRGKWADRPTYRVLMSLIRNRPRDLVKLFHLAARAAKQDNSKKIIESKHLEGRLETYSQDRLQDIINEFKSELPKIEPLLFELKPTSKGRRTANSYLFTTDKLVLKLKEAMSHVSLAFTNKKPATPHALIQFLYKIDFITARKGADDFIDRKYFDQSRFLASEIADFGYDWEIHPAYRWALQPQDINAVFDTLDSEDDH